MAKAKKAELPKEHQQVINEYLHCWNQTVAYQRVYKCTYDAARFSAARLFANANIQQEVQRRIDENAMSANEVLARLAEHARSDFDDFLDDDGSFDLKKARAERKTRLIKKYKKRTITRMIGDDEVVTVETEIDLHDAQAALLQIGKHLDLFSDKINIKLEKELNSALDALEKSLDSDTYAKVLAVLAGKLGGAKAEGD